MFANVQVVDIHTHKSKRMNQFSNQNSERIRYWIKNNIHMVWDAVRKLQEIPNQSMILRITFYKESYPIVMQWAKLSSPELGIGTDNERTNFISEDMWLISGEFSSINAFADWVNNVK